MVGGCCFDKSHLWKRTEDIAYMQISKYYSLSPPERYKLRIQAERVRYEVHWPALPHDATAAQPTFKGWLVVLKRLKCQAFCLPICYWIGHIC